MTNMKATDIGKYTALSSFIIGSLLFFMYYLSSASDILFLGYGFVLVAFLVNVGILVRLVFLSISSNPPKGIGWTIGLMSLNLPIAFIYFYIVLILLNTMRITFTNGAQAEIIDITVIGCGGGNIDKLNIGESETIWVEITGDCEISVSYTENGVRKEETVISYVTASMGQKWTHVIDGKDKDIL